MSNEEVSPTQSLDGIDNKALNHWLPRCLLEVRKQDRNHYTGGSLYNLSSGIQRYVHKKRATSNVSLWIYSRTLSLCILGVY